MKAGRKLIFGFSIAAALVAAVGGFSLWQMHTIAGPLTDKIPAIVNHIVETSHQDSTSQFIRYYDEVLTQSARNYAFTQDKKWELRYRQVEPKLDRMIKRAIEEGGETDKEFFSGVDKANLALVQMEYKAIELVNSNRPWEAVEILESSEYWEHKDSYEQGLRNYIARRGAKYDEALAASTKVIDWATSQTRSLLETSVFLVAVVVLIAIALVGIIGFAVSCLVSSPFRRLRKAVAEVVRAHPDFEAESISEDEVSQLVESLNEMARKLQGLEGEAKKHYLETSPADTELKVRTARHSQTTSVLHGRIKELNCLYGLSKLIEQPGISLEEIFQKSTAMVCNAYRNPDKTCIRITFDGIQYKSDNFNKTEISQHAAINAQQKEQGAIEVYYLGQMPASGREPFLKEESELLEAVARRLGGAAGQIQAIEKLQLFRDLIDRSNDCIFVMEPKWGRFLDVNDKAYSSLGYTQQELLDMTVKDIDGSIPNDDAWASQVEQVRRQGSIVLETLHKRKDGTMFPVEINVKLISQGKSSYLVAGARDITERKQAEQKQDELLLELESVNKELKDFAHIVSHDLKAPLRGIKSLVDWITTDYSDKLDDDGKEQMGLLVSRVDRMRNLIDGVLQYSRIGRVKEEKVPVDLAEIVPEAVDMVSPPENIEITIENQMPVVECEKTRIQQVFQNLLSNAIKYMDKPQGRIKVGCVEEDGFWKFSVSDNGPGIEEQYFEKIFQIFQTLAARDEFESTGVGLSVVKKVVEMYGGRIWVESELGKGSTFFFTMPKAETAAEAEKLQAGAVS